MNVKKAASDCAVPGETQLETDRRLLSDSHSIDFRAAGKGAQTARSGAPLPNPPEIPTVSLVGYTNAGKSTLFNRMTAFGVYAADQLFATLDPTLRRVDLENVGPVVLGRYSGLYRPFAPQAGRGVQGDSGGDAQC